MKNNQIKIYKNSKIRTLWDADAEKWYISIVDVIAVLTESKNPQVYWRVLKKRLLKEGNETVTNCNGLKMLAQDGKMRKTAVADTEQLFRLIQSIPSRKAEPFKLWLAQLATERLDEMQDPEITIDRALKQYLELGYSENWINHLLLNKKQTVSQLKEMIRQTIFQFQIELRRSILFVETILKTKNSPIGATY